MSSFKRAERKKARLRMALDGPSGSGKSYTALRFAFSNPNEHLKIACIEAGENGGLSLYLGENPDGRPFAFDILELSKNFSPTEYTNAIEDAGRAGYDILVIDSLSHAWTGAGGALEQVGAAGFTDKDGWRKVTPQHNRMIDAILQSPCHVICTMRSKTEYVIEEEGGRKTVKKIGMAPVQRAGMEYEFTVYGSLDHSHTLTITKSRCSAVQDAIAYKPSARFMLPVWEWLATGSAVTVTEITKRIGGQEYDKLNQLLKGLSPAKVTERLITLYGVSDLKSLNLDQANELIAKLEEKKKASAANPANVSTENVPSSETSEPV